jgi:hypothetical protein
MPTLIPTAADLPELIARLRATPVRLAALAAPHSADRLTEKPRPKGWSPVEHLAHLRGCDLVWTATIYAMLAEAEPTLPLFHPRDWVTKLKLTRHSYADLLAALTARRAELLLTLEPLAVEGWARTGLIDGHRTNVFSQARRLAGHEAEHLAQLDAELPARAK